MHRKGNQYSIQYVNKTSDKNKNVDIQFSEHDAFLERHSSGTLEIERLESQIILNKSAKLLCLYSPHFVRPIT
jgi:hypothetical protein